MRQLLLLLGLLAAPAQTAFDPAVTVVRIADADQDGDVAAAEWPAFVAGLGADEAGVLDPRAVIARVAFADLETDGDGVLSAAEVERALAASGGAGGVGRFFLDALADSDQDGAVSDPERERFLAGLPDGPLGLDVLVGWVRAIEALPPPPADDRGRMVPPVVLAGILPALDVDANGQLSLDDLNALHRRADASGDGVVTAAELAAGGRGGAAAGDRWEVDSAARERPPRMPWQRTLEDALWVQERTQKPLLICVNIDGENASEALAFGRYRDPEFARLAGGFVCVLASPDVREPLERDDRGRRLPDRRFGRLVDSEHVSIEPALFERWFQGTRVAPRHVGVAPDGAILFDLYLLQDLSIVDAKLREHGLHDAPPREAPRALPLDALLESADAADRDELERRFVELDPMSRRRLAPRALEDGRAVQHPELVHLALRDPDPEVRRAGARLLAAAPQSFPLALVPAAFAVVAGDEVERDALVAGLAAAAEHARTAGDDERARDASFLRRVFATLDRPAPGLDVARWRVLYAGARAEPPRAEAPEDFDAIARSVAVVDAALVARPDDAALLLRRAELLAALARTAMLSGRNPLYFLGDTEAAADDALRVAPDDGRALALRAFAIYQQNRVAEAGDAAAAALPRLAREAGSRLAGETLDVLAAARTRALYDAIAAGEAWDEALLPEALAAHAALCAHPGATEAHHVRRLELLGACRAFHAQHAALAEALHAFPASETLHNWLRFVELRDAGSRALESAYEELPAPPDALAATWTWFHGLATLVAAEHDVQCRDAEAARGAYARAAERFQRSAEREPAFEPSAAHYRALALAGLARLALEAGELDAATASLTQALGAAPASAEQADGLGRSPADTARALRDALSAAGRSDLEGALAEALEQAGLAL